MTRKKGRPHHRETVSTEFEGYKMLWSSIENDENTVQRMPSPVDIPKNSHPVGDAMGDSDGVSDGCCTNQVMSKTSKGTSSPPYIPDRRVSSDNSLDESSSYFRNLLNDLPSNICSEESSTAILPSINSSSEPPELSSSNLVQPHHLQSPSFKQCAPVSQFPCGNSSPRIDSSPHPHSENSSSARVVENNENSLRESVQPVENFSRKIHHSTNNVHSENGSSSENTQFSDLIPSPPSVPPLVELSDLTPLLGNSPQSPDREEPIDETEAPTVESEPLPVDPKSTSEPAIDAPAIDLNLDSSKPVSDTIESLKNLQLSIEPSVVPSLPSTISNLDPSPTIQVADQSVAETEEARPTAENPNEIPVLPEASTCDDVQDSVVPDTSPAESDDESETAADINNTKVCSPFPSEMHEEMLKLNDPVNTLQSEDNNFNCVQADEMDCSSPVSQPAHSSFMTSSTTSQALNVLREMLMSNDDATLSCVEPLGPDFDPSNITFLTTSEIKKDVFGHRDEELSSVAETVTSQHEKGNLTAPTSHLKPKMYNEEFPVSSNFLPSIIKIEPEFKSFSRTVYDDFFKCLFEDSGFVNIMSDYDENSSDSCDDSIDNECFHIPCKVRIERLPADLIETDHVSLLSRPYVLWWKKFAHRRNEELFQNLRVWRRGRLLLWRECELAGMDRATYNSQVEYITKHRIEVSSSDSDSSDDEDCDTIEPPTNLVSTDSSESEAEESQIALISNHIQPRDKIRRKPRPKSKMQEYEFKDLSGVSSNILPSPKEDYAVERFTRAEEISPVEKPNPASKITIRKSSISKSDDENEGFVERELSSDDDIVAPPLLADKKVRRVAMKRTTRRVHSPIQAHIVPDPIVPSSSTDDESIPNPHSPQKTSPPDAVRKKKSFFFEENDEDESMLGRRADEVENHNLLERFEIPFEAPTLFRSPRVASKLCQLRNKEAFKSNFGKNTKAPKPDPIQKDVRELVDDLVMKTVNAILTQARSSRPTQPVAEKKPTSVPESIDVKPVENRPTTFEKVSVSESSKNSVNEGKLDNGLKKIVKTKSDNLPARNITSDEIQKLYHKDAQNEITSTVARCTKEEKQISTTFSEEFTAPDTRTSEKELGVTSSRQSSSPNSSGYSDFSKSYLKSPNESEAVAQDDVADNLGRSSHLSEVDNTTSSTTSKKEDMSKQDQEADVEDSEDNPVQRRVTRARQPVVEVDLNLIEKLSTKKRKLQSSHKNCEIKESDYEIPESTDNTHESDDVFDFPADDCVTASVKPKTRKGKRRRLSRFATKKRIRPSKPASEKVVEESNSESEKGDDLSKPLVQVAEISEGRGDEQQEVVPLPVTPEPEFTPRVLRSHPKAAIHIRMPTGSTEDDSNTVQEEVDKSDTVMQAENLEDDYAPDEPKSLTKIDTSSKTENSQRTDTQSGIISSEEPLDKMEISPAESLPESVLDTGMLKLKNVEEPVDDNEELVPLPTNEEESDFECTDSVEKSVPELDIAITDIETTKEPRKSADDETSALFDAFLAKPFFKKAPSKSLTGDNESSSTIASKECSPSKQLSTGTDVEGSEELKNQKKDESPKLPGYFQAVAQPTSEIVFQNNIEPSSRSAVGEKIVTDDNNKVDSFDLGAAPISTVLDAPVTTMLDDKDPDTLDAAMTENAKQAFIDGADQLDFSSLSNILDMADSAEDLIIDQPFSDEEPEQNDLNACIIDIIQNHIVVDSPPKPSKEASNEETKLQKRNSIDERTGLPTTLIQRLRDPRIRSKVMSQLEGNENVAPHRVQPPPPVVPTPNDSILATPIVDPKENALRPVENVTRDPRALRSSTMRTRSSVDVTPIPKLGSQVSLSHSVGTNQESVSSANVSSTPQVNVASIAPTTNTLTPAEQNAAVTEVVEDEEEEEDALKRRPKKLKKKVDTELVYKSPLEDLEKEPQQSYGRNLPRRYPVNESRPRKYADPRPNRWDVRHAGKTGPQESLRHPDAKMPPVLPQHTPLMPVVPPVLHAYNQQTWMMDQNSDCLPSYVESPHWQGSWVNEQQFNSIDHRKNLVYEIERGPKTANLKRSSIRKVVDPYINKAFKDMMPKPKFELNPDDEEILISMMDPFGQEINMLQLPRPTANVTKSQIKAAFHYEEIDSMVSNPGQLFACYMDEEKVDEQVFNFSEEEDATKIVRMQSHVPIKRFVEAETEKCDDEMKSVVKTVKKLTPKKENIDLKKVKDIEKPKESVGLIGKLVGMISGDQAEPKKPRMEETPADDNKKEVSEPKIGSKAKISNPGETTGASVEHSSENVIKTPKKIKEPKPEDGMDILKNLLNHLPILKEQYSFKSKVSPLLAPLPIQTDTSKIPVPPEPPILSNFRPKTSIPDTPSSPSPPLASKATPVNLVPPSPPRIMKAIQLLTKSDKSAPRISKRSRTKSPPFRLSKSPQPNRRSNTSRRRSSHNSPSYRRRSRSKSPESYRRKSSRRSRSPPSHRHRRRLSKETTSSGSSTPRYSRSTRSSSSSRYRRSRSRSSSVSRSYRRSKSSSRSPSFKYRSRSRSSSPPRKRQSRR